MKSLLIICACMQAVLASLSYAAGDAAIEAQEGNVDHWIKFYEKERGTFGVPPAAEPKPTISGQQDAKQRDSDTSPIMRAPESVDRKHD